jgi:AcrR family transcriptional regulator
MVRERRAKGQAREQRVIQAAAEVIAERGLDNVRIVDIADRAGMSPGHVNYYFESKTELLMRAIMWSEGRFHTLVVQEIHPLTDPWERLERLIELAAADGPGDPGWVLWFEIWSRAGNDPTVAEVSEALGGRWDSTIAEIVRYGSTQGAFADVDADQVATLLSAVIDGLSIQLTLGAQGTSRQSVLDLCSSAAHLLLGPGTPSPLS